MKKAIAILIGSALIIMGYFSYKYYFSNNKNLNSVHLIPRNAIYFVSSDNPLQSWKIIRNSETWQHLQTNSYFAKLTSNADSLDQILKDNKKLFDLLGDKKLLISAHPISTRNYDFLYITDLEKTAKFLQFKNLLKSLFNKSFKITERTYKNVEIVEFFNKKTRETLYLSVVNNNLIASYTHTLVEASIDQLSEPTIGRDLKFVEINQKVKEDRLFQLFVQYNFMDEFVRILSNTSPEWIQDLSENLVFSGFDIDLIDGNKIHAKGFTNMNENSISYWQSFEHLGAGSHQIAKVAPHRTSMYLSLGFNDFSKFYDNYEKLQEKDPSSFEKVTENTEKLEDLLSIDIQKNFIDWIDDEIAILKLEPMSEGENDDFALVLKAKDAKLASKNLDFILERIKKKTPVKFKEIEYKGNPIKFMSIKGFFKLFFGGFFKDLVTPYYTIIDDFVIFSNHPNTLKYIITSSQERKTLDKAANYKQFKKNFEAKSNLFIYINTPMLYPTLLNAVDNKTREDLDKNRAYFTSFSQIGFQFFAKESIFNSTFVIQYKDQESIQYSDEFKPPTVGPLLENSKSDKKPIIVIENTDPFDVLDINPNDLNADEFVKKYSDGKIKVEVPLKNGMKNGVYKAYYKNGELHFKGRFKDDKRVGKWKKYDMEGNRILQVNY